MYRLVKTLFVCFKTENPKKCFTNQRFGDIISRLEPVYSAFGSPFIPLLSHRV